MLAINLVAPVPKIYIKNIHSHWKILVLKEEQHFKDLCEISECVIGPK